MSLWYCHAPAFSALGSSPIAWAGNLLFPSGHSFESAITSQSAGMCEFAFGEWGMGSSLGIPSGVAVLVSATVVISLDEFSVDQPC